MLKIWQNWGKIANYPPQCSTKICTTAHKPPVVRLCFRLDSFGITGLYVEAQGIGSVIEPIADYAPNATSEYQAFLDQVNDALL